MTLEANLLWLPALASLLVSGFAVGVLFGLGGVTGVSYLSFSEPFALFPFESSVFFASSIFLPGVGSLAAGAVGFSIKPIEMSVIGQSSKFFTHTLFLLSSVHDCYPGQTTNPS